jgi:hypothetical protein
MSQPCKHTQQTSRHTCSFDKSTTYCVYCLWEKTILIDPIYVHINLFKTSAHEVHWDNLTLKDIFYPQSEPAAKHLLKIIKADLNYPILVVYLNGKYSILDGCHRYVKAVLLQNITVMSCIVVDDFILQQCLWIPNK